MTQIKNYAFWRKYPKGSLVTWVGDIYLATKDIWYFGSPSWNYNWDIQPKVSPPPPFYQQR